MDAGVPMMLAAALTIRVSELALKLAKLARDKLETVEPFVVAPHEHDRRPGRQRLQGLVDMQEEQAVVDKLVRQLVEG